MGKFVNVLQAQFTYADADAEGHRLEATVSAYDTALCVIKNCVRRRQGGPRRRCVTVLSLLTDFVSQWGLLLKSVSPRWRCHSEASLHEASVFSRAIDFVHNGARFSWPYSTLIHGASAVELPAIRLLQLFSSILLSLTTGICSWLAVRLSVNATRKIVSHV